MKKRIKVIIMLFAVISSLCLSGSLVNAQEETVKEEQHCAHWSGNYGSSINAQEPTARAGLYCAHGSSNYITSYVWNQSYYSAINGTKHGYYVFIIEQCSKCWNSGGRYLLYSTSSHTKKTKDLGHSGSTHKFSEYCTTCGYTIRTYSSSCSGPPCNVPLNNTLPI